MTIVSLTEAKLAGAPRYFTGVPCKRGHVAERFTSDRSCSVCRAEQALARYHANPESARAREKAWRTGNASKKLAYGKQWRKTHHEAVVGYGLSARARQPLGAAVERTKAWRAANPERTRFHSLLYQNKRRAAEISRTPAWADLDAIKVIYQDAAEFRAAGLEVDVDHRVPLQGVLVSGLHVPENLRVCLSSFNRSKSNTFQI
jgi:hypothetical protein